MKKGIIGLVVGLFIGLSFSLAGPAYSAVKQYILTEFSQPVVVNGVQYKDKENPILSYKGSTYIPLAKIGEMTGVEYKYNKDKKQVEIGSSTTAKSGDVKFYVTDRGRVRDSAAVLAEEEAIRNFTEKNKTVQVKDNENKAEKETEESWKQVYKEMADHSKIEGEWVSEIGLKNNADIILGYGDLSENIHSRKLLAPYKVGEIRETLLEFTLPEQWNGTKDQPEAERNGLRIKLVSGEYYFKVEDLFKLNILPKDFNEKVQEYYDNLPVGGTGV